MPSVRIALKILKPETVIAWHRAGFRAYGRHSQLFGTYRKEGLPARNAWGTASGR